MRTPQEITTIMDTLRRTAVLAYGSVVYALFLATFLSLIGFVQGIVLPRSIDSGNEASLLEALAVNGSIVALFAIQHTIMARLGFKRRWTKIVPPAVERATFVLLTCLILGLLMWQWRSVPTVVWEIQNPVWATAVTLLSWAGWVLVLLATFLIDHFDLFGLKQSVLYFRNQRYRQPQFQLRSVYRYVRHPLYLGFLTAFWAAPVMTLGHLMFASLLTLYVAIGIQFEERTLMAVHGRDYKRYRRQVAMLLPFGRRSKGERPLVSASMSDGYGIGRER